MQSIREVLRLLLMGKRYSKYWRSRRTEELKRLGYDVGNARHRKPRKH